MQEKKRRGVWSARQIKMHEREVAIKFKLMHIQAQLKKREEMCVCVCI